MFTPDLSIDGTSKKKLGGTSNKQRARKSYQMSLEEPEGSETWEEKGMNGVKEPSQEAEGRREEFRGTYRVLHASTRP